MKPFWAWIAANQLLVAFFFIIAVGLIIWAVIYFNQDKPDVIVEPVEPVVAPRFNFITPVRVPATPTVPSVPNGNNGINAGARLQGSVQH